MKQLVAIGLLGLLLFNMLGHYPVYTGLQWQAKQDMERRLDTEDIYGQELFQLKIPMNLPYWQSMKDYERASGSFEHNGDFYTLFKQKVQNDTLVLVCVKDHRQQRILSAFQEIFQLTFSDAADSHQKAAKFLENLIKDYLPLPHQLWVEAEPLVVAFSPLSDRYQEHPYDAFIANPSPPPNLSSFGRSA
ncbi:MAG: hypothetical protein U0Y10_23780 [Spirosomataceae bacterium]